MVPRALIAVSPPDLDGRGGHARRSIDPGQRRSARNRCLVRSGLDVVVTVARHRSRAAFHSGRKRDAAVRAVAVRTTGRALLTVLLEGTVGAAVVRSVIQKPEAHFRRNARHSRELQRHQSNEHAQRQNHESRQSAEERTAFRGHRGCHAFTLRRLAIRWGW